MAKILTVFIVFIFLLNLCSCILINFTSKNEFASKDELAGLVTKFENIANLTASLTDTVSTLIRENESLLNTTKMQEEKLQRQQQIITLMQADLNTIKMTSSSSVKDDLVGLHNDVVANKQALSTLRDDLIYLNREKELINNRTFLNENAISTMSIDLNQLHSDRDILNITTAANEKALSTIRFVLNQFHRDRDILNAKTASNEKRISVLMTSVGFSAYNMNDMNIKQNQAIVFDTVISAVGTGYSKQTGIFTAPVSGKYVAYASLRGDEEFVLCYIKIFKNGSALTTLFFKKNNYNEGDSTMVYVQLRKGDRIWLAHTSTSPCLVDNLSTFTVMLDKAIVD